MANWQPSASIPNLRLRAEILAAIRKFFAIRDVLEVETPLLGGTTATDPHLESIRVKQVFSSDEQEFFLQTSPEFAMKKLLAAGSGSIYQLCKAFRQDERSKRHNPEFTMLEWYRIGFNEHQLMDEVEELVATVTGRQIQLRISYRQLFQQHLAIDPHSCSDSELLVVAKQHRAFNESGYRRDELLHLLLAEVIEPAMEQDCFVYDFPANQAALATVETDESGMKVARRFELFMSGMEIANGYLELVDGSEQQRRFNQDNQQRKGMGRAELPIDHDLLAAIKHGLPVCSGVAIGVDRLVMLALNAGSIDEVISFPLDSN
jgi:lysyl-tRNA synthetase class 2